MTYSSRVRVLTYLLPTFLGSLLLNLPKFLEARHEYILDTDTDNFTRLTLSFNVTELRFRPWLH